MASLRRFAVRFLLWAGLIIAVVAAAAAAGLHWWVIAVGAAAWLASIVADRALERSLGAEPVAGAEPDRVQVATALVAGAVHEPSAPAEVSVTAVVAALPRAAAEAAPPEPEPAAPAEPDQLVTATGLVAAPVPGPREPVAPPAEPVAPPERVAPPQPVEAPLEPVATPPEPEPPVVPEPAPPPPAAQPTPLPVLTGGELLEKRWSIWTLDRLARETGEEELLFLVSELHDYADIDGLLPVQFDSLVRESFGRFLGSAAA